MSTLRQMPDVVLSILFFALFVVNLLQVVFRFGGASLSWSEELARYLFVWCTYLGMALNIRDKDYILIDVLADVKGKDKLLGRIDAVQKICTFSLSVLLMIFAAQYTYTLIARNLVSPAMQMPMWIPVISLVVGTLLSAIYLSQQFFKEHIKGLPTRSDEESAQ